MPKTITPQPLPMGEPASYGPAAVISRRAAERLRGGYLWVYASDVEKIVPGASGEPVLPGALLSVVDAREIPLGTALFSASSQIALRMVSPQPALSHAAYLEDVRARVHAALDLRDRLAPVSGNSNACRLIFSEADNLPGIVADRYNDLVLLQLLTQGTAQEDVRQLLTEVLRERLQPATIVERPDPRIRELEELPAPSSEPLFSEAGLQLTTVFTLNGLRFHYDATAGQKTGAFLDQRLNYTAAAQYGSGAALDICTYQGGFALHLAQVCQRVTGVDTSLAALEVADRNLELNSGLMAQVDWIEADAFLLLRDFDASGQRFDTIVLDPPAFTKSKRSAEGAARGYKELNLRALRMLQPGGRLITCSCSHHMPLEDFTAVVAAAASDAHRTAQVLEVRGAAPDHPAILTLPETSYLKCLIVQVN